MPNPVAISPVEDIVAELAAGRMVILVDEEDRENEGDLVMAAEHVTAEAINFMAKFGRGLICLTLTRERCEYLKLPPMASSNGTLYATAFTVSIEAAVGVTTGISAADRAKRCKSRSPPLASLPISCSPGTSSLYKRLMVACSCALATQRPAATLQPWQAVPRLR